MAEDRIVKFNARLDVRTVSLLITDNKQQNHLRKYLTLIQHCRYKITMQRIF